MTEDEAKGWIADRFGSSMSSLAQFVDLVRDEAPRQNLVSASSLDAIWARHIVDSAQLFLGDSSAGLWLDIGSGAGFPGMVIAIIADRPILLVEPRRRRVEFLRRSIDTLGLNNRVEVSQSRVEIVAERASTISARAVASIDAVLASAIQCSSADTRWVLPKGRNAPAEVAAARKSWHGTFHVEQSVTDPESMIVIASGIARR